MSADNIFNALSHDNIQRALHRSLSNAIDGELFLEKMLAETIVLDQSTIRQCSRVQAAGFGLRAVYDPFVSYAYGNHLTEKTLTESVAHVEKSPFAHSVQAIGPQAGFVPPYKEGYTEGPTVSDRVTLLQALDQYARQKYAGVVQVQATLACGEQHVAIHRMDYQPFEDHRPMAQFRVMVVLHRNGKQAMGFSGCGGRLSLVHVMTPAQGQALVDEAVRLAELDLEARPAPAGEFPVVLGSGWTGVLLHEAVGHGLEGDANRRRTSLFCDQMGEMVASSDVTVVDDGTLTDARGSLKMDDEGTPSQRTVLIENGRLVGYMQDRLNARMMGSMSTGNCRRESYASIPMVRMTNTFMVAGQSTREEMLHTMGTGILALQFGGGQVDISSGNFVFSATEAYWVENGAISYPIKGVTLMGNGADVLKKIKMVGQDFALDPGIGSCGKDGQMVPVSVGQPSVYIAGLTIGGTQVA